MRDPDERAASLALRNGGPASVRRAVGWYRTHDRLRCGDQITMAVDALAAYKKDAAAGRDALLVCDTTEMTDALSQRLHRDTIAADTPTVTGARGHRIGVGDLILTRRNDATIALRNTNDPSAEHSPVRNGQRWRVTHINPGTNRIAARRLDDDTLGAFTDDYVRDHISYGYAVTVHTAQGVTADTTHAVLSDTATRALAYVAFTRGREANTGYLYQRPIEHEQQHVSAEVAHSVSRGTAQQAATLLRGITANDQHPVTAHDLAATTASEPRPSRVRAAVERRARAVRDRSGVYRRWRAEAVTFDRSVETVRSRDIGTDRSIGEGLEF